MEMESDMDMDMDMGTIVMTGASFNAALPPETVIENYSQNEMKMIKEG